MTLLHATNITFLYRDVQALRDVSIHLSAGEVVALIGPNGSGKSTLIKTLIGVLRAHGGETRWDDKPIRQWPRRALARHVAYLAQSPLYEPGQLVIDALRLGRVAYWSLFGIESAQDEKVVREVAQRLELNDILTRDMDAISGGQRQRVFVGRALVQEPRAILLDEPNTFLDLRHQVELTQLLRSLARERNVGVLMASHDLNLAGAGADRLVLLDRGSVAAEGRPEHVLDPSLLARVYGVALDRFDRPGTAPVVVPRLEQAG